MRRIVLASAVTMTALFVLAPHASALALDRLAEGAKDVPTPNLARVAEGGAEAAGAVGSTIAAAALALARGALVVVGGLASLAAALLASLANLALEAGRSVASRPREATLLATGVAGGALYTPVWRLYSRLEPGQILEAPQRAGLYERIRAAPGVQPTELMAATGLGWGTVMYHLRRLESARLVAARKVGTRRCYFASGMDLTAAEQVAVGVLKTDRAREIVDHVRSHPGVTQKDLAHALGMSAALVSWHVKRLTTTGMVACERRGRVTALFAS